MQLARGDLNENFLVYDGNVEILKPARKTNDPELEPLTSNIEPVNDAKLQAPRPNSTLTHLPGPLNKKSTLLHQKSTLITLHLRLQLLKEFL
jgi:hypothetical protein